MIPGEPEMTEPGHTRQCQITNMVGRNSTPSRWRWHTERFGIAVSIARLQNCYGPEGTGKAAGRKRRPRFAEKSQERKLITQVAGYYCIESKSALQNEIHV